MGKTLSDNIHKLSLHEQGIHASPDDADAELFERLRIILSGAVETLQLGGASIYLLNRSRDLLQRYVSVDAHGNKTLAPAGQLSYKPSDMPKEDAVDTIQTTEGCENVSDAVIPLKSGQEVIGMLYASNKKGGTQALDNTKSLGVFANQAAYAIEATRAEARRAMEARHERTLFDVSSAISSALDPNEVLQMVARLMAQGVNSSRSAVYVWEIDLDQLRRRTDSGVSEKTAKHFSVIPFTRDSGIAEELSQNQSVSLSLKSTDALQQQMCQSIGAENAIAIPLISKDRLIAVAIVATPKDRISFNIDEISLLMAIAAQAAVSIENATLYEAQHRAVTELAALYAVSQALATTLNLSDRLHVVAESIAAVTGVSRCGVFLIEEGRARGHLMIGVPQEEQERFCKLNLALNERETALMQAIKEGRPTVIDRSVSMRDGYIAAHWRIKRLLAVPLIYEGRTVGLAAADEPGQTVTFSPNATKVAGAIGEQAALFIQNARLFEQTRQHAEDLGVLWEASQALSAELGLEDLLDSLIQHIHRLPMTEALSIMIRNWDGALFIARDVGVRARFRNEAALKDPCDTMCLPTLQGSELRIVRNVPRHSTARTQKQLQHSEYSVLSVPLVQVGQTTGIINVMAPPTHEFTASEINLIGSIGSLAAAAIARAQVFERERRIAETFQRSLLPDIGERIGDFEVAHHYAAALEEARVGGDFYDVFHISDNKCALVIGDVSGKGLDAAVHTAMTKYMLRAYAFEDSDPGQILARMNDALCFYVPASLFVTLFAAVLDTSSGLVHYASAGHELPLLWSGKDGSFKSLACTGRALGFLPSCVYVTEQAQLEPGDTLIMYTDGVTEARNAEGFFDIAGIRQAVRTIAGSSAAQIAEAIETRVREHTNGKLKDDIALLVVVNKRS